MAYSRKRGKNLALPPCTLSSPETFSDHSASLTKWLVPVPAAATSKAQRVTWERSSSSHVSGASQAASPISQGSSWYPNTSTPESPYSSSENP